MVFNYKIKEDREKAYQYINEHGDWDVFWFNPSTIDIINYANKLYYETN